MSTQGRMVWFNLDTGDVQASKDFYTQVVGWGIQEWGDCPKPYSMWTADGAPLGGVGEHPPELKQAGAPPQWIGYVAVADVDATAARVEELGGRVHTPGTDIPGVGRFAVVADPQGARFALLSSDGAAPAPDVQRTGSVGWHELHTVDHGAAWEFYSALFGWAHATTIDTGGHGDYFIFRHADDPEGTMMGAMFDAAAEENRAPEWLYYVNVDDMDGAVARIRDRGGRVLFGPMDVPGGGRSAQCMDPQGGRFAVFALK